MPCCQIETHSGIMDTTQVLLQKSDELYQEFWNWRLESFPELATAIGDHKHDDKLVDISLDGFENRYDDSKWFLKEVTSQISSFKKENLPYTDLEVLKFGLTTYVEGFKYEPYLCALNVSEGPHVSIPYLLSLMPHNKAEDFKNILSRIHLVPSQIDKTIILLKEGIRKGITLNECSVYPLLKRIKDMLALPVNESPFFRTFKSKPTMMQDDEWLALTDKCCKFLETDVNPSFQKLIDFLESTYLMHTRDEISVSSLPGEIYFYRACLKYHTSTDLSPGEIHDLGLKEVERIQSRMEKLVEDIQFKGSYIELIKTIKDNEASSFNYGEQDVVDGYSNLYDEITKELPKFFNCFPKQKCYIKPYRSTASSIYKPGTGDKPGTFWINVSRVKGLSFTSKSLALHEMIPGHHLQRDVVLQQKDTVNLRRFKESGNYWCIPNRFPLFTALMEGWAMYAEHLGEEMGFYKTPNDLLGRLYSELFRASRLVVDTGIHAFNWSKEKAIDYMTKVVGMERKNAVLEVERYILWPGQACSYKIGEIKIKEFRETTSKELGNEFDIKEFHDLIMHSGEVPFEIMENNIHLYISKKKGGEKLDIRKLVS